MKKKLIVMISLVLLVAVLPLCLYACNRNYDCYNKIYYSEENPNNGSEAVSIIKPNTGKVYVNYVCTDGVKRKLKLDKTSKENITVDGKSVKAVVFRFETTWRTTNWDGVFKKHSESVEYIYVPDGDYILKSRGSTVKFRQLQDINAG